MFKRECGTGKMVPRTKHLLHKHEDPISDPQDLGRKPGIGACAYDLNFRRRQICRTRALMSQSRVLIS